MPDTVKRPDRGQTRYGARGAASKTQKPHSFNNTGMRVRCRNLRCRSKLPVPTENDHKAFCSPFCHAQFFHWKCAVCETPIPRGRHSKPRKCCRDPKCRSAYRRFHETYSPTENPSGGHREPIREADVKNPCGTGAFFGEEAFEGGAGRHPKASTGCSFTTAMWPLSRVPRVIGKLPTRAQSRCRERRP